MNSKLIIAAMTVMTIVIATPQGSVAHAQQQGMQMQKGESPQNEGMQKHGMQGGKMGKNTHHKSMMGNMHMMKKMRKRMMGKMFMVRKKAYTNTDIKRMVDGRLATHGFSRLIAGDVVDGSNEPSRSAIVSVVSPKGEFLFKVEVNRKTGMAAIIE